MEASSEPIDGPRSETQPFDSKYMQLPRWRRKFNRWKTLQSSCPATAGNAGLYCLWEGRSCGYNICPLRVFEEEEIDPSKIPVKPPSPKLNKRLTKMQTRIDELQKQVNKLTNPD